jgi:hypothetical protein
MHHNAYLIEITTQESALFISTQWIKIYPIRGFNGFKGLFLPQRASLLINPGFIHEHETHLQ